MNWVAIAGVYLIGTIAYIALETVINPEPSPRLPLLLLLAFLALSAGSIFRKKEDTFIRMPNQGAIEHWIPNVSYSQRLAWLLHNKTVNSTTIALALVLALKQHAAHTRSDPDKMDHEATQAPQVIKKLVSDPDMALATITEFSEMYKEDKIASYSQQQL